jgi:hypothetical protein
MSYEEPGFQEALKTRADGVYSKQLPISQLLMDIKRLLSNRAVAQTEPGGKVSGVGRASSAQNTLLPSADLRMRSGD